MKKIFLVFACLICLAALLFILYYSVNFSKPAYKGAAPGFSILCRECAVAQLAPFKDKLIHTGYGDIIIVDILPVAGSQSGTILTVKVAGSQPDQKTIHFGTQIVFYIGSGITINGLVINE